MAAKRSMQSIAEQHLSATDTTMARLIAQHGPCTLGKKARDPFAVLAASIIGQQLSSKAANTIQKRVESVLGSELHPASLLQLSQESLRACGLSNAKAKWLLALSQAAADGTLDFAALDSMDDETAIATLDALPGIGRWTAEMFLIFALNRMDLFAMGDVGLRNAINQLYGKGRKLSDARTMKITQVWTPYRSVASWYLWRSIEGENPNW